MRQVSVLLTKYSDWISSLVYHVGGRGLPTAPFLWRKTRIRITASTTADLRWRPWKSTAAGGKDSRCIQLQVSAAAYARIKGGSRICSRTGRNAAIRGSACFPVSALPGEGALFLLPVCGRAPAGERRGPAAERPLLLSAQPICRGAPRHARLPGGAVRRHLKASVLTFLKQNANIRQTKGRYTMSR